MPSRRASTISTRDLRGLPAIDELRRLCQSLAMLDAIIEPEWEFRYYSFNRRWSRGERMASMRNGQGDEWFILFDRHGAAMKGFDHESPMADPDNCPWPGVLDSLPKAFASFRKEPAFSMQDTTFCVWRRYADAAWNVGAIDFPPGADPDGSARMLAILDGRPQTYRRWAEGYYERDVPLKWVRAVYSHQPLTDALVQGLNPEQTLPDLREDVLEIGYPAPTEGRP
jgi:hypothetical protein